MIVTAGKTNVSVYFYIVQDASATSPGEPVTGLLFSDIETGGSASYARQGAARTDLTLVTLASASAAHTDGGFILVDDTNMPGVYRCDYPDAAFATGVDQVVCSLTVASAKNAVAAPIYIDITDVDLRDSVRGGMTALPNAAADAAGGLPISDAGALDMDSIKTDTGTTLVTKLNDIQGATFSSATDSLEAIRNRGDAAWTTGAGGSDRLLMVDTTIATLSTQTNFTLTAGSTDDDAYNNLTIVVEDVTTSTQKSVGTVTDYVGATKTVNLKEAPSFTIAATDKVYILAENSLKSTVKNRQLDVTAGGTAGIDWANIEAPTTAVDLSGTDIQLVDTVTTYTGNTPQTGDAFARLGAPAGASIAVDIATAQADLDLVTGSDGVTLATAQANYAPAKAGDSMDVTSIAGDSTAATNLKASALGIVVGTATGTPTTTTMADSALTETTTDHYNGRIIVWTTGALAGQISDITGYNGATKTFTFTATTNAASAGDAYVIV